MHRINIFCGNYGSGKTEISLNTALRCAAQRPTTLVDLDIVNPYFRSSEQTEMLSRHGVSVLCPTFANTSVDIPSLPASIQSIFADKSRTVIIDVGGDDTGSTALGRYHGFLSREDVCACLVVNARRPFSKGADELMVMLEDIQSKARIKMDCIINNTNMACLTTVSDIMYGAEVTEELSARCGIPVKCVCGTKALLEQLPDSYKVPRFPIEIYMRPDWLDETSISEDVQ